SGGAMSQTFGDLLDAGQALVPICRESGHQPGRGVQALRLQGVADLAAPAAAADQARTVEDDKVLGDSLSTDRDALGQLRGGRLIFRKQNVQDPPTGRIADRPPEAV